MQKLGAVDGLGSTFSQARYHRFGGHPPHGEVLDPRRALREGGIHWFTVVLLQLWSVNTSWSCRFSLLEIQAAIHCSDNE
ncbi:hypothetical protein M413DRAFT_449677 [Hebeloma cylindrosporum]|uniref:Uncharacterized protein n=1 Tax=Hebeloma cylindrosporum TaxID=76867 RepID=A0A0C2Y3J6_HEBCY|nr:hypothetical protein M413DRAFT_449677 [Hebeloma cylindrosporum h7]